MVERLPGEHRSRPGSRLSTTQAGPVPARWSSLSHKGEGLDERERKGLDMDKAERRRLARGRKAAAATRKALLGEEIGAETDRSYVPAKRAQHDRQRGTIPGLAAQNWITVPPRTRGTIADAWQPASRMSFSESVIAGHDPNVARPKAGYTEVRPPVVIGFTGGKSATPESTNRQGQAMRDGIEIAWETHHKPLVSGHALREGRPQYRAGRSALRSTTKLGDFAGD